MPVEVQNGQISAVAETPAAAPVTAAQPQQTAATAPAGRVTFTRPSAPTTTPAPQTKFEEPTVFGDPGDEDAPKTATVADLTPETPAEPEPPKQDPLQAAAAHELYRAARALGFSPSEITAFESPQQLQAAVAAASRVARSVQPAAPTPAPPPVADEFPEAHLKELGVDDKVIATLKAGFEAKQAASRLEETITQKLARLEAIEQQREKATYYQQLDQTFAGLGEQYAPIFGAGSGQQIIAEHRSKPGEVAPVPPEILRRNAVIGIAVQQQQQYQAAGYAPPPFHQLVASAAEAMFGTQQQQAQAKRDVGDRLRAQNGQFLPRPTNREEQPLPKGDRAALENLRKRMGGVHYDDSDAEIEATLLP